MASLNFYATRNDMLPRLLQAEKARPIEYVLMGSFPTNSVNRSKTANDLSHLGQSPYGHWGEPGYLLVDAGSSVAVEPVKQRRGGVPYFIDEEANPHAVSFYPSGLYGDEALILGLISTDHRSPEATRLYHVMESHLLADFQMVGDCWVGPEAMESLRRGFRLTPGIKWAREADLVLPAQFVART